MSHHLVRLFCTCFFVFCFGSISAAELDDFSVVDHLDEFDALYTIKDPVEREARARNICWELYQDAMGATRMAVALPFSSLGFDSAVDGNPDLVSIGGMAQTGASILADASYSQTHFARRMGILNNAMTDLGGLMVTYHFAVSIYNDDAQMEIDSWVYAKNMMIYMINRYPWSGTMATFALGVAAIDFTLNKVLNDIIDTYDESWYEVYEWFYLEGPGKLTLEQWADHFTPPMDLVDNAYTGEDAPGTYQEYMNAFWDHPEQFTLPGAGSPISTMEIYEYYLQNELEVTKRTIFRDVYASVDFKNAYSGEFLRDNIADAVRPILENRRDLFHGEILNRIRDEEKRIAYNLRRLNERKDYSVIVLDKSSGDPIADATVKFTTMYENGGFTSDRSGQGMINVPLHTPKLNFQIDKIGYKPSTDDFYPNEDFGPSVMVHLEPMATRGLTLQVIDERSQRPIPNAKIQYLFEGRRDELLSDSEGYVWRDFPDGMLVEVTVEANGYYTLPNIAYQLHEDPVFRVMKLQSLEGAAVNDLLIKVMTDYDDGPVPEAKVTITSSGHQDEGVTDYRGYVQLKAAPDVISTLTASADQYLPASDKINVSPINPEVIIWMKRGGILQAPKNLTIKLDGDAKTSKVGRELKLSYKYSIPQGKKHDIKLMIKGPDGQEHASKYFADIVSQTGGESGIIRMEPVASPGRYEARLLVRYGGEIEQSESFAFTAEWADSFDISIMSDSGEKDIVRQFESALAIISPEPSSSIDVERVDWFLITNDGRRIASSDNHQERTKGRSGLTNDLKMGARAQFGKYGVEAKIITPNGVIDSAGNFELVPPEDVPENSEFSNIQVTWSGTIKTGAYLPLTLRQGDSELIEMSRATIRGLGQYKGSFEIRRGTVFFRPRLSGNQQAMFALKDNNNEWFIKFDCNPSRSIIVARTEDLTVNGTGSLELMIRASGDFVPPLKVRRQSPAGFFQMGPYSEQPNVLLAKGELNVSNLDEVPQIDLRDAENAEATLDVSSIVRRLPINVTQASLGQEVPIDLRGLSQLGAVTEVGVIHTGNVEVQWNGRRPTFVLKTDEHDNRRQFVQIVVAGSGGIGFGSEWIQLQPFAGDLANNSDCEPPSNIKPLIERMMRMSNGSNPLTSAMNQRDYQQVQQLSGSYFDDAARVFNWMSGLNKCEMLTDQDRRYFADMSDLMVDMKKMSNPESIDPNMISEFTRKAQSIQNQSRSVEQRLRKSGFYEFVFE